LARATLAFVYGRALGSASDRIGSVAETEAQVREHAHRALDLDPDQGLAYAALASIDEAYWRISESGVNWEKALVVTPNDPDVLDEAVKFYALTGQLEKARPLAARAQILNPANYAITQLWLHLGDKNYDEMVVVARQAIDDPGFAGDPWIRMFLALSEALRGANELALDELRIFEELDADLNHADNVSWAVYAYGRIGRTDDAQQLFNRFQDLANDERLSTTVTPISHVWANLGIGADEEAFRWDPIRGESRSGKLS
jgi:tetratricopeptide (TPR) repeat protein